MVIFVSIIFKTNILDDLKNVGYSSYKLRVEKLLSEGTMTKLRNADTSITLNNLGTLCKLLNCQPSDLIEYVPDENA